MVLIFLAHSLCLFVACKLYNLHCVLCTSPSWFSVDSCWWSISSQKKDVKKVNSEAISVTKALDSILTAWRCTCTGIKIRRDERLEALNVVVHAEVLESTYSRCRVLFCPYRGLTKYFLHRGFSFLLVCVKKPRFLVIITLYLIKYLAIVHNRPSLLSAVIEQVGA